MALKAMQKAPRRQKGEQSPWQLPEPSSVLAAPMLLQAAGIGGSCQNKVARITHVGHASGFAQQVKLSVQQQSSDRGQVVFYFRDSQEGNLQFSKISATSEC